MDFAEKIKMLGKKAKEKDRQMQIFGASSHKYEFNPVISEEKVRKFEKYYNIKLPDAYVVYLTRVGNGGAGPNYGLYSLETVAKKNKHWLSKQSDEIFLDRKDKTGEWREMCELYDQAAELENDEECLRIEEIIYNGALVISTPGCTMYTILMCKGENYGKIGIIDTDMMEEYEPRISDKTFEEWILEYFQQFSATIA